jgi:acyl-CoA synthetase (AMP-forming)/AMP-acid ligase II
MISPYGERVPLSDLTVGRVGAHIAHTVPSRVALDDGESRLTYGELDERVNRLATALRRLGVAQDAVVAAYLPNCIAYVLVVLATARAGGVFSPINPRFKGREITDIFRISRPVVVFATAERVDMVRAAAASADLEQLMIVVTDVGGDQGTFACDRLLETEPEPLPAVSEMAPFSLMFTSGTTGKPKGALATHRARMIWVLNAAILYGLSDSDVYLGAMPQVHSAGLTFTLMHLYVGGTVQILKEFNARRYLEIVETKGVTSSLVVPTMLTLILEEMQTGDREYRLSSLRRLVTCGAPLPLATKKKVIETLTDQLYDYYGSTESNSMSVLRPSDQLRKPYSVGKPFTNVELMIASASGERLPAGKIGEIWCRNPSVMIGYYKQPEATAAAFTDGWYRTGDVGHLDDDGYLHLVGRVTDVIISGGVNIYPAEIEDVLMMHPGILDCAVVGTPDPKWGEVVSAFVVPRKGWTIDLAEVQRHCQAHIADYKKPRRLEIRSELPKTVGGKTIKTNLLSS